MTEFDERERRQWAGRADAYVRSFATLCAHPAPVLLDAVGAASGTRLLVVGTGPGTVAALAGTRGASVTAVDAEPGMVELARRNAPDADIKIGILPELPFDDGSFDAAVANFVINHVGEPAAAVAELRRVVRPGGRIAVTIWPYPAPPLQALVGQAVTAAGAPVPAGAPRLPAEVDFPRTVDGLATLLSDVSLTGVSGETITWRHRTDVEEWWSGPASGIGTAGYVLAGQTAEMHGRIRREYERLCGQYRVGGGRLAVPTAALLATGRAR